MIQINITEWTIDYLVLIDWYNREFQYSFSELSSPLVC